MKAVILTDLEGIIGYHLSPSEEEIFQAWAQNINCAIDEIRSVNAGIGITVINIHNNGLDTEQLKPLCCHDGVDLLGGMEQLTALPEDYSYAVMIGFHGKSHAEGYYPHSFRDDIECILFGEEKREVGEVFLFQKYLELKHIPVVFISGEGGFLDEIDEDWKGSYIVNPEEGSDQLSLFRESLHRAVEYFNRSKPPLPPVKDASICIALKNEDMLAYVPEDRFRISEGIILIDSIVSCIETILPLAVALRTATYHIIRRNAELCHALRPYLDEIQKDPDIMAIITKPLELVTEKEYLFVRERYPGKKS